MTESIDVAVQRLVTAGLVTASEMVGCSEAELRSLEQECGFELPTTYRRFLERLGKAAGQFLVGTDFLFPRLRELKTAAQLLLRENGAPLRLGEQDFVFAVHQGYQFLFFSADGGPDPSVFHYEEGDAEARCVAPSFTKWFDDCVTDEIAAAAEISTR